MSATPVIRNYSGSDANLLQKANLNQTLLSENLAAFTAEDPTMDAAFVTAYATDITEAEVVDIDELVEDTLSDKTATVVAAQDAVAKKVKQVRYYVLQAFENDKAVQKKFGLDAWDAARKSQVNTLQFLTKMHTVAMEYQTQLTAAGFDAARTTSILTVRQALEDSDSDQEHYRSGRPKLTALRIQEYNEVYDRLTRVNRLAQIVYADDYEMRKQFVFSASSTTDDGTVYMGDIAPSAEDTIAPVTYKESGTIKFENVGDTALRFWLNVFADENGGTAVDVAAGGVESRTMVALNANPTASFLQVQNIGETAGSWKVTVG